MCEDVLATPCCIFWYDSCSDGKVLQEAGSLHTVGLTNNSGINETSWNNCTLREEQNHIGRLLGRSV